MLISADGIEVYSDKFEMYLSEYAEEFKDGKTSTAEYVTRQMPQNQWKAALVHIGRKVFDPKDLKTPDRAHDAYDIDKVEQLLDLYLEKCARYDKVPDISGFAWFSGVSDATIYDWSVGGYQKDRRGVTSSTLDSRKRSIYDKLRNAQEEALTGKLSTGKQNPVSFIAILNHKYGWNLDSRTGEEKAPVALPASELPKLGNPEAAALPSLAPDPGPVSSPGNDSDTGKASPWLPKL